jgi:hypothetical protein
MKKLPVGKSDFKQIIEENYCYVDKTLFIKDVIDKGDAILLVPRPRRFGKRIIYNPWSIINFLGSEEKELKPYWVNTSDNKLVEGLLSKGGKELRKELEQLIRGDTIEKVIEDNIILKDLSTSAVNRKKCIMRWWPAC